MHLITQNDKQQGREMAWHGLTDVKPELSLANCWLREWDYKPEAIKLESGGKTSFMALRVTDEAIGLELNEETGEETLTGGPLIVGNPYDRHTFKPLTNARLLELLDKGTDGKDLVLSSCGTVKNRGRQFLSFELGQSYRAAGREFRPFFNVGNGNDKSSPIWQNISSTCTVCNNTYTMNMLESGLIMSVKKTKFSELKLADFGKAMKAMLAGQREFADMFEALGLVKCDEATARSFFAGFIGKPKQALTARSENIVDRLVTLFKTGRGNGGADFADVFSALTDYYTHESANADGGQAANWKNFISSEFGAARDSKQRAWLLLNVESKREETIAMGREVLTATTTAASKEAFKARMSQAN